MKKYYNIVKYGNKCKRRNFSKINEILKLPNLIDIQMNSYKWFLKEGLFEVLNDIFPIKDYKDKMKLEILNFELKEPKFSVNNSKINDVSYASPLYINFRLTNCETGEIKEQLVFFGEIPLITNTGTFIINGVERVVVSQLIRSPGLYFYKKDEKNNFNNFGATIIPSRGAWIEIEMDSKGYLYIKIDRNKKILLSLFLYSLGFNENNQILKIFGNDENLIKTLKKDFEKLNKKSLIIEESLKIIYEKFRPGEPKNLENSRNLLKNRFLNLKRYSLEKVGRYKVNKKLNLKNRLLNLKIAEDLIDKKTNKIIFKKGTILNKSNMKILSKYIDYGINEYKIDIFKEGIFENKILKIQIFKVFSNKNKNKIVNIIGNNEKNDLNINIIGIIDILKTINYFLNLKEFIGNIDDIDHLGNRRVRSVGELLQNQIRIGLIRIEKIVCERMLNNDINTLTLQQLINIRPIVAIIKEFFCSSQLSQFMDQTNPLGELTHKRRLSSLGPGGLTRERAGYEVRDVHYTHYGRLCPIETPEGPNIGLISSLSNYARINKLGFIETPYRKVDKKTHCVTNNVDYLMADEEDKYIVAQANSVLDKNGKFVEKLVMARKKSENLEVNANQVDYMDVSPKQVVSIATACIPFLENDDSNRALMGANMQRQAVPLMMPDSPIVGTGMEYIAAHDSGSALICKEDGIVKYVDSSKIIILNFKNKLDEYKIIKFYRSNACTSYNQIPIINIGDIVKKNDILADGPAMKNGELALGQNVLVALMTWEGYNYEDAIVMSDRLVKDDVYTSIHIEEYEVESRDTKLGMEEITREIPNINEELLKNLDENGIIYIGAEVKDGDLLVGKITPKGVVGLSSEERLLHAVFGDKSREVRDTSLRVPHGGGGIVHDVKIFKKKNGDELSSGINMLVRVYIIQKRKINEGDKMAGRHGNKGVVSCIVPEVDMPFLPNGVPIDIMLNPLGVPSRMNIGQLLELHLGMAAYLLNVKVATPVFDGANYEDVKLIANESKMNKDMKTVLYDGRTGKCFDNKISVGMMYIIKLAHMVDDKLHARSIGPYSLVTQQPLGGKAQFGGQRFGEMEVWALEAYGAAYTLQEILTYKSDDIIGRLKIYESIIKGDKIPNPGVPESFRVLIKELQSIGLDICILDEDNKELDLKNIDDF